MKNIKITNRKTKKSYFINQAEHDQMKESGVLKRFDVEFNAKVPKGADFTPKELRNLREENDKKNTAKAEEGKANS